MKRENRKIALVCLIVTCTVLCCLMSSAAFAAPADPAQKDSNETAPVSSVKDFAGTYICTGLSFGENIVPLSEDESYTLTIEDDEAVITGIEELGTDPKTLAFENGILSWTPPEEEQPVFILGMKEDGIVTLTFTMIPEAPVFLFAPGHVLEDFAGAYTCTGLSFGENIVPLSEDESYTLTIEGDEAVITGMEELGADPKTLIFENGKLSWTPPEEEQPVFILDMEEDGIVTLTFTINPEIPVFRFTPDAKPETEEQQVEG